MDPLQQLLDTEARAGGRWLAWFVALLLLACIGWSTVARLDEVAVAAGEVVPGGKVKVIQHLEGGIIEKILVQESQAVAEGDPLVQIELPLSAVNLEELRVRRDGLILQRERLAAERDGRELALPTAEAERQPLLAQAQAQAFQARRTEQQSRLHSLEDVTRQRQHQVRELQATLQGLEADLKVAERGAAITRDLLKDSLVSKLDHLERERDVSRLQGQAQSLRPAIPRTEAALSEAREKLREERLRTQREALEELSKVELELARSLELMAESSRQAQRTVIRSPIAGAVKNLRYNTIGGVVRPGDPIMEIVPSETDLLIEAKLSPIDRGYVAIGQRARAKVTAYDYVRYGALDGEIVRIAPDSTVTSDGHSYFGVAVRLDRGYLGKEPGELPLTAGMVATVDIATGQRTVMQFLLRPLLRMRDEALRER